MSVVIPFTPPHVSINRVRIVELPGITADPEICDKIAYQLLSSKALTNFVRQEADALGLPAAFLVDSSYTRVELPHYLNQSIHSPKPQIATVAQKIGQRLGRNLGHILLALHRGDAVNQQARPDWSPAEWQRWNSIRQVWLGGGLVNGELGHLIAHHAQQFIQQNGYRDQLTVSRSPYRGEMGLVGAGRYLPAASRQVIALDCGHTLIKRACLLYADGTLEQIHRLQPLPVDWDELGEPGDPSSDRGKRVLDFLSNAIAQSLNECLHAGLSPDRDIMLSVAAYVEQGRLLGNGIYAQMMALAEDARPLLANQIRELTGKKVQIHLIHDGTAAAALHAGGLNAAVIIIGTALGVGFPPPTADYLRPLAPALT